LGRLEHEPVSRQAGFPQPEQGPLWQEPLVLAQERPLLALVQPASAEEVLLQARSRVSFLRL
jgi:hypothetical protein